MLKRFWHEYDPNSKVNLVFNQLGQPSGLKTSRLTNFIGSLVKGKEISLAFANWSKVPKSEKDKLWNTVKVNTEPTKHKTQFFAILFSSVL
jgi:hypothetical protein